VPVVSREMEPIHPYAAVVPSRAAFERVQSSPELQCATKARAQRDLGSVLPTPPTVLFFV